MQGAGVEKLAKAVWNLHRVSADVRLHSAVMGKPSWVPISKCSFMCYTCHLCTLAWWGGKYVECARILESTLEWLEDWETNLCYCILN